MKTEYIKTIGDLKKEIADIPDNVPVRFIADTDDQYCRAFAGISKTAMVGFDDGEGNFGSEYSKEKWNNDLDNFNPNNDPGLVKLTDKVPMVIISLDNFDFWDFEDDEYEILNGVRQKPQLT